MREILFKAKRKDNGEWVEGYYIYHIKRTICPFNDSVKPEDEQHVIMQDGFSDWNMPRDTVVFDIDPKTICQYTGLKDKNGNRIWENDIVEAWSEGQKAIGKVKRRIDGLYIMYPAYQKKFWGLLPDDLGETTVNIIGNIFDNPELLERRKHEAGKKWGERMNKCPFCGSDKGYYQYECVERALIFDFEGNPNGSTEDVTIKAGKRCYCANCDRVLPKKMFEMRK